MKAPLLIFLQFYCITSIQDAFSDPFVWVSNIGGGSPRFSSLNKMSGDLSVNPNGSTFSVGDMANTDSCKFVCGFLSKTTTDGKSEWLKLYQDSTSLLWSAINVSADRQGNAFVFARRMNMKDYTISLFLSKWNGQGQEIWRRQLKTDASTEACLPQCPSSLDSNGNLRIFSQWTCVDLSKRGQNKSSGQVTFWDTTGNVVWSKTISLPNTICDRNTNSDAIAGDIYGNTIIAGDIIDTAIFKDSIISVSNKNTLFLAKYDSSGKEIWIRTYETAGEGHSEFQPAYAKILHTDRNGEIIGFTKLRSPVNDQSSIVIKFDEMGKINWAFPTDLHPFGIESSNSGNIFVAGINKSEQLSLSQIDNQGQLAWTNLSEKGITYPRIDSKRVGWMKLGGNGHLYLSGAYDSLGFVPLYQDPLSYTMRVIFVGKAHTSKMVSISQKVSPRKDFKFTLDQGILTVAFESDIKKSLVLKIFNLDGTQIYHKSIKATGEGIKTTVDLTTIKPGIYFLKLIVDSKESSHLLLR